MYRNMQVLRERPDATNSFDVLPHSPPRVDRATRIPLRTPTPPDCPLVVLTIYNGIELTPVIEVDAVLVIIPEV